jgi:hypothetical protein
MRAKSSEQNDKRIEDAKAFVRSVLAETAGQQLDEDTLNSVARKIVRALPPPRKPRASPQAA